MNETLLRWFAKPLISRQILKNCVKISFYINLKKIEKKFTHLLMSKKFYEIFWLTIGFWRKVNSSLQKGVAKTWSIGWCVRHVIKLLIHWLKGLVNDQYAIQFERSNLMYPKLTCLLQSLNFLPCGSLFHNQLLKHKGYSNWHLVMHIFIILISRYDLKSVIVNTTNK